MLGACMLISYDYSSEMHDLIKNNLSTPTTLKQNLLLSAQKPPGSRSETYMNARNAPPSFHTQTNLVRPSHTFLTSQFLTLPNLIAIVATPPPQNINPTASTHPHPYHVHSTSTPSSPPSFKSRFGNTPSTLYLSIDMNMGRV